MSDKTLIMVPYFKGLSEDALELLENNSTVRFYPKGAHIFYADEACTHLYIVKSGLIRIFLTGEDGREITIHYVGKGRFMGDTILFNEDRYGANACAVEDTQLLMIENKALEKIIFRCPEIAVRMLADFGNRLKKMMNLMGEVTLNDVRKRLIRLLYEMAKAHGTEKDGKILLDRITTQEDMAWRIGTTREVLCRELHRLEKEGVLTADRGRIVINDLSRLNGKPLSAGEAVFPTKGL